MTEEEALAYAHSPVDWGGGLITHNWRNHVGENVQRLWDTFTIEQKVAIILDAQAEAENEDWE